MERKKERSKRERRRVINSAFADRKAVSDELSYETHRNFKKMDQPHQQQMDDSEWENENSADEGKGKGKMPAIDTTPAPSKWHSDHDTSIDVTKYPRSDAYMRYCHRPLQEYAAAGPSRSTDNEDSEQPSDINDWGVEKPDGVLVGHPPQYPVGLLDWNDKDTGKKLSEVAPDNLTRAKTAAASAAISVANTVATSTLRVAQGALQGIIGGVDTGEGSSKEKGNQGEQPKKDKKKKKRRSKGKKGKFAKTPQEQTAPEHRYQYSDYYDSEDGSDWVTL